MKFSRIAAAVTTAALAPAVLIASPAFAAGPDAPANGNHPAPTTPDRTTSDQTVPDQTVPDQAEEDRKTILAIIAHPMASEFMQEAGRKAIADGPKAMRKFIEVDQHNIRMDDYRIEILRLLPGAGPGLKEGINKVLSNGNTIEKLRHFYDVTQHELRDDDNKVEISRLIGTGGTGVKEAGKKALQGTPADRAEFLKTGRHLAQAQDDLVELARIDEGWDGPILTEAIGKLMNGSPTPAELRHFLEVTQYELRDQDNRVAIAKIIDGGGPELVKAGRAALAGTPADRTEFLKTGRHEARAKDQAAKDNEKPTPGKDGKDGEGNGTGTDSGTSGTTGTGTTTGNTAITAQGHNGSPLATTGAGDHTTLIAGGAGTALAAGAGLLLAARMRRAGAAR
ncbi:ALF repeat-containing protein [Streptomyces virginiae]|uniref:ALF repeat-containing protein n=1 Tax=Streptomyces virginiae TaxID=1961 RepID=UPI00225BF389|nr:ALF repeat-containing protein [Streptomyces virginiae]MCX4962125.1 ALF repeat-containing protein [Streptomyces virginiae]